MGHCKQKQQQSHNSLIKSNTFTKQIPCLKNCDSYWEFKIIYTNLSLKSSQIRGSIQQREKKSYKMVCLMSKVYRVLINFRNSEYKGFKTNFYKKFIRAWIEFDEVTETTFHFAKSNGQFSVFILFGHSHPLKAKTKPKQKSFSLASEILWDSTLFSLYISHQSFSVNLSNASTAIWPLKVEVLKAWLLNPLFPHCISYP